MSDPKSSDSPQLKFTLELLQSLQRKELEPLAKALPNDYRQIFHPRSLGKPEQTREEYLEYVAGFLKLWNEFEVTADFIADIPGKVIYRATFTAKTSDGVDVMRESIFIKHIVTDEDGSLKIKQGEEFVDSKAYLDTIQAFAAANAKGQ